MDNINVKFPIQWLVYFSSQKNFEEEARKAVVLDLVRTHKISQGKGAELLGMNRWDFYDLLAEHNIPTVDLSPEELDEGMENIHQVSKGDE